VRIQETAPQEQTPIASGISWRETVKSPNINPAATFGIALRPCRSTVLSSEPMSILCNSRQCWKQQQESHRPFRKSPRPFAKVGIQYMVPNPPVESQQVRKNQS
jgi:hypothetical protein